MSDCVTDSSKPYRLHFETMEWRHKFHVIPHICRTLDINPDKAESVFHQLRNKGIIVYNKRRNAWRGTAYAWDTDPKDAVGQLWAESKSLRRYLKQLRKNDLILRDELETALKRILALEQKTL